MTGPERDTRYTELVNQTRKLASPEFKNKLQIRGWHEETLSNTSTNILQQSKNSILASNDSMFKHESITPESISSYDYLVYAKKKTSWIACVLNDADAFLEAPVKPAMLAFKNGGLVTAYWCFHESDDYDLIKKTEYRLSRSINSWAANNDFVHVTNPYRSGVQVLVNDSYDADVNLEEIFGRLPVIEPPVDVDMLALKGRSNPREAMGKGALPVDALKLLTRNTRIPAVSDGKKGKEQKSRPVGTVNYWSHWSMETKHATAPWIAVDLDEKNSVERLFAGTVPRPSFIIANSRTGHAQGFWLIESVFKENTRMLAFYEGVRANLTRILGGDTNFTNHRVQNPYWDVMGVNGINVIVPDPNHMRTSLTSIYKVLRRAGEWEYAKPVESKSSSDFVARVARKNQTWSLKRILGYTGAHGKTVRTGSRNNTLFKMATWLEWHGENPALIKQVKCDEPLSPRELKRIITSVQSYHERKTSKNFVSKQRLKLSKYGHKGGLADTIAQKKARDDNFEIGVKINSSIARSTRSLVYRNVLTSKSSKSEVAKSIGVSRPTLYKHLHAIKDMVNTYIKDKASGTYCNWTDFLRSLDDPVMQGLEDPFANGNPEFIEINPTEDARTPVDTVKP